jgi:hypothetical protein
MTLKHAYEKGCRAALEKFALDPPNAVDAFMGAVESGKDVAPVPALPPMSHAPGETLPALDGTTPLSTSPPTPPGLGSTVGVPPAMSGDPAAQPPPMMGALG